MSATLAMGTVLMTSSVAAFLSEGSTVSMAWSMPVPSTGFVYPKPNAASERRRLSPAIRGRSRAWSSLGVPTATQVDRAPPAAAKVQRPPDIWEAGLVAPWSDVTGKNPW
jgi:hypothetical protein